MTTVRIIATTAIAIAAFSAACKEKDASQDEAKPAVVNAQTVVVTPQAFTETIGALGTVAARSGHVATLSAPAAGRVGRVLVSAGQTVASGEPLVELDQAPFAAALQSAEATLAAAERANERQQRLAQEGIVPRKDAEQAAADLARAQSDAVAARRNAQLSVLRAPIGGVVTRMSATLGASVDPAQPLVEISDPTSLDVLLSVTPTQAAEVQPGAKVALSAGQNATGEPLGVGAVTDVSRTVDSVTRSVAVRVQAPTTRRPLRIGETVNGAISVATRAAAIVIPADALVPEGEDFKVFVVDASGVAHEREVKIGGRSAAGVEITDGLKAGERVVTYGAYGMQDSAKVVPLTTEKASPPAVPPSPNKSPAKP
jgi:membrane fusion protein (multidrug efflux system)